MRLSQCLEGGLPLQNVLPPLKFPNCLERGGASKDMLSVSTLGTPTSGDTVAGDEGVVTGCDVGGGGTCDVTLQVGQVQVQGESIYSNGAQYSGSSSPVGEDTGVHLARGPHEVHVPAVTSPSLRGYGRHTVPLCIFPENVYISVHSALVQVVGSLIY